MGKAKKRCCAVAPIVCLVWLAQLSWSVPATPAAPGDVDPRFGLNGVVTSGFGQRPEASTANDVLRQPDGKLVAVGSRASYGSSFVVTRFGQNGVPDPGFGGGDGVVTTDAGAVSLATSVAQQPDGKLVVAGRAADDCQLIYAVCTYHIAMARYTADGSLDPSFGGDGLVTIPLLPGVQDLAIQGEKVVFSTAFTGSADVIARLTPEGSLDPSFGGGDGIVPDQFGHAIAIQADGKLVAAGVVNVLEDCIKGQCTYTHQSRVSRYLEDGSVDPSFGGGDGRAEGGGAGPAQTVEAAAIQPDGKILLAGEIPPSGQGVARLNSDGSVDQSFGAAEVAATFDRFGARIRALALSPLGSIVVAGGRDSSRSHNLIIVRVDSSGALDPAFGKNGAVTDDRRQPANAILLDGTGGIVVAADTGRDTFGGGTYGGDLALSRYRSNGTLDLGFGLDGFATTAFLGASTDQATSVSLAPVGKVVAAGTSSRQCIGSAGCRFDFAVSRFTADGSPDQGFGDHGDAITDLGGLATVLDVTVEPDGKVLAAGKASNNCAGGSTFDDTFRCDFELALARYQPGGSLDRSFGSDGIVRSSALNGANAVSLRGDGKILVAGETGSPPSAFCVSNCDSSLAIAQFNPDGSPDPAFGESGVAAVDLGEGDEAMDLLLLPGGDIVATGAHTGCSQGFCDERSVLLRFHADGSLDPAFGDNGIVSADAPPGLDLALDPRSGDLLELVGQSLLRYRPDGRLDTDFGQQGSISFGHLNGIAHAYEVEIDPLRRIVVGGSTGTVGCGPLPRLVLEGCAFLVARFNPDGSLDRSFGGGDGVATPDLGQQTAERAAAGSITIGSGGSIVAAGTAYRPLEPNQFALARLQGGGPPLRRCHGRYSSIVGTRGRDRLVGTRHRDVISGLGGPDSIRSLAGDDLVCGDAGADRLFGGIGVDRLLGGDGQDILRGGPGRDTLRGGAGKDVELP